MREDLFVPGGSLGTWLRLPYVLPSWRLLVLAFHFVASTLSNCDSRWVSSTPFFSLIMTYCRALSRAFLCRASWFLHFFSCSKERYAKNWIRRTDNNKRHSDLCGWDELPYPWSVMCTHLRLIKPIYMYYLVWRVQCKGHDCADLFADIPVRFWENRFLRSQMISWELNSIILEHIEQDSKYTLSLRWSVNFSEGAHVNFHSIKLRSVLNRWLEILACQSTAYVPFCSQSSSDHHSKGF